LVPEPDAQSALRRGAQPSNVAYSALHRKKSAPASEAEVES
jgi:hypothetical protein